MHWLKYLPTFSRRQFKLHFLELHCVSVQIPLKLARKLSCWQYIIIGLVDGLAPNRQMAWITEHLNARSCVYEYIEAASRMYASVNQATIGSDNCLRLLGGHYLNQWWLIVNWNTFQWNFDRDTNIFIEEYAFKNVVCETPAILSQCGKCIFKQPIRSYVIKPCCLTWNFTWMDLF